MLWQKEPEGAEAIYVDILKESNFDVQKFEVQVDLEFMQTEAPPTSPKVDALSTKIRCEGNAFMVEGDMDAAILKYNKAILVAELGTENMGLCYANRAACFLQLKKYAMCLRDIELAKQNGYPNRLLAKLEEQEAKCSKLMEASGNKESHRLKAELSFPPNEKIPCFASGIEMSHSNDGKCHIVTERSLEIGDTIIVEEPYQWISEYPHDYRHCANCFKSDVNLIPCRNCIVVMFCSPECYEAGHEKFHDIECGVNRRFIMWEPFRRLAFRTIIAAIKTFGSVEALMDAIELFNVEKRFDETDIAKRNYFKFFGSPQSFVSHQEQQQRLHFFVTFIQRVITKESILKSMFTTKKTQRFLSHLIMHHLYVLNRYGVIANNFAEHTYRAELGVFHMRLGKVIAHGIALDGMHMNHSCVPNVCRIFVGRQIIYKAIRPIKSGSELYTTYMHPIVLLHPTAIRAALLSSYFPLKCECISCQSNFPPFKKFGYANMDAALFRLLRLLDGLPQKFVKRVMGVDRTKLDAYEKAIVEHLQRMDNLHPTEATLKLQFFLAQIWNIQYAICSI